ncbi:MAG: ATP-binding cassette domain-containing protein [Peptococcaceae bacterium]|nr:ATP-binding cassette domain-containing protein [Peptococcaceae bacterium]
MLQLKNVNLTLEGEQGKKQILKDISLTLEKNKIYVMTGPNGGGKSSIAKIIMGIYQPTDGQILLEGEDISTLGVSERARLGIGYAFQQPPRFKGIKVKDVLELAAGDNAKVNICDLLYDVGLCSQDYLDREIDASFSGGELKRVEIASILARKLKVAVFDEPEAGIDLWSFQKLTETFENLNHMSDTTIVIISHQERILRLAHQVIVVSEGMISEITTPDKFLGEIEKLETDCRCKNNCTFIGGRTDVQCDR